MRRYLKPIGDDHRGVFVSSSGKVLSMKDVNGTKISKMMQIAKANNGTATGRSSRKVKLEDMGDGVALKTIEEEDEPARRTSTAVEDLGESDDDFLPDYSDAESDEVEYRTDAIALKEAADAEVAAQLDDEFDSDAMEEFGELQDDFISFATAEEQQHPVLETADEHVKVAENFETERRKLMRQVGLLEDEEEDDDGVVADNDDEEEVDPSKIPFGFGLAPADSHRRHHVDSDEDADDEDVHDSSDVVGAAERYRQRFVDEHFNVRMRREYDDEDQWGEIDDEVKGGGLNPDSELFNDIMDEFLEAPLELMRDFKERQSQLTEAEKEKGVQIALQHGTKDLPALTEEEYFNRPKRNNWDCATIVSTYSNLENHPSVIDGDDMSGVIVLSSKTGLPLVNPKAKRKKKKKLLQQLRGDNADLDEVKEESDEAYDSAEELEESDDGTVMTTMSTASISVRSKNETAAEKKARKAAVKAARREARVSGATRFQCLPLLCLWNVYLRRDIRHRPFAI